MIINIPGTVVFREYPIYPPHCILWRWALFQMSILVHPDKNPDDRDRAQTAFDSKSWSSAYFLVRHCIVYFVYQNNVHRWLVEVPVISLMSCNCLRCITVVWHVSACDISNDSKCTLVLCLFRRVDLSFRVELGPVQTQRNRNVK